MYLHVTLIRGFLLNLSQKALEEVCSDTTRMHFEEVALWEDVRERRESEEFTHSLWFTSTLKKEEPRELHTLFLSFMSEFVYT